MLRRLTPLSWIFIAFALSYSAFTLFAHQTGMLENTQLMGLASVLDLIGGGISVTNDLARAK